MNSELMDDKYKKAKNLISKINLVRDLLSDIPLIFSNYTRDAVLTKYISTLKNKLNKEPRNEFISIRLFHAYWDLNKRLEALSESKRFLKLNGYSENYNEIISEIENKTIGKYYTY